MDFAWLHDSLTPLGGYESEHRTVYIVRILVHLSGCSMIFTGSAGHPFLRTNRRLMVASLVLIGSAMAMEEYHVDNPNPNLRILKLLCYKVAEILLSALVLLGCFLLRSITLRENYRLNYVLYVALGLHFSVLALDNVIKLGYLGNTLIAAAALWTLRDFLSAFVAGAGGSQVDNVRALMHLQAMLTVLNLVTFFTSLYSNVFGLKLAQYVLQIFAITLFYIFVRPYIEQPVIKDAGDVDKLMGPMA